MTLHSNTATTAPTIDLDFTLTHFEEAIWPRPISTFATQNCQVEVNSREAALNLFDYATLLDCKIRAFPSYVEWKGLNRQPPNLIFIDLDLLRFTSKLALDRCLNRTLTNLKEKLDNAHPTVMWSGGGYHIIQPTKGFLLEDYDVFESFEQPSRKFLQFAEQFLSNRKNDPCHTSTISFKNCMLRVPGSYNSKYIQFNDKGKIENIPPEAEVKIIRQWDGKRPAINWLLRDFRRYLIEDKYNKKQRKHYHPPTEFCTYWRSSKSDT
jgi:hypothetical protein